MINSAANILLLRVGRDPKTMPSHPRHLFPPLDLKYIQAALKNDLGEAPLFLDGWLLNDSPSAFTKKAMAHRPQAVVIKASTPYLREAVEVTRALKEQGAFTIAIGQQVNHVLNVSYPGWRETVDAPILGDPEMATPELLHKLISGKDPEALRRDYRKRFEAGEAFLLTDPNDLPRPIFSKRELRSYPFPYAITGKPIHRWGYVLGSWGCPYKCRHCSQVVRKTTGSVLRKRSPKSLINEVASLLDQGARAISFEDDTFFFDRNHVKAVCGEIIDRGLKFSWIANARANEIDEETAALAAKAGAKMFKVSVESGSEQIVENLGKVTCGKEWIEAARCTFPLLHQHGINTVGLFLVGNPGETYSDVETSIKLACELNPTYLQVQLFSLYPDIPAFDKLINSQKIPSLYGNQYHYAGSSITVSRMESSKLVTCQSRFYWRFYLRSSYIRAHLRRFWRYYLCSLPKIIRAFSETIWLLARYFKSRRD